MIDEFQAAGGEQLHRPQRGLELPHRRAIGGGIFEQVAVVVVSHRDRHVSQGRLQPLRRPSQVLNE